MYRLKRASVALALILVSAEATTAAAQDPAPADVGAQEQRQEQAQPWAASGASRSDDGANTGAAKRAATAATMRQEFKAPEGLTTGQPVVITLSITHDEGALIEAPTQTNSARWEIVKTEQESAPLKDKPGQKTTTLRLYVIPLKAGSTSLGPLSVGVVGADGQQQTLQTEPIKLKPVTTLPLDQEAQLKAPLGPEQVLIEDYKPLWIGLGLLGCALIALLFVLAWRYKLKQPDSPAPQKPAHTLALEALSELAATQLIERGEFLAFYTRESEIIRDFLGKQFGFPGTELTTSEIGQRLADESWPQALALDDVKRWLKRCDKVKFTDDTPSAQEAEASLRQAFSIVELTRNHQEQLRQEAERAAQQAQSTDEQPAPSADEQPAPQNDDKPKAEPAMVVSAGGFEAWAKIAQEALDAPEDEEAADAADAAGDEVEPKPERASEASTPIEELERPTQAPQPGEETR